jgi:hypothetical protein
MDIRETVNPALRRGKKVPDDQLEPDLFEAREGFIQLIYGRIRQGKSTEAVRRMVEALSNGVAVYSNIALNLENLTLDDRVNAGVIIVNNFLFKKRFYSFDVRNYHFFDPVLGLCDGVQVYNPQKRGAEITWLNSLTDCEIYYDEGQWLLDSYERTDASVEKRKLITESGHMNRLVVIIAQRTQSIHVNARGNVNQFYRCSKKSFLGIINMLMVEEFQDMSGSDVDETAEPISVKRYLTNKKYWSLFNTHYLRRGRPKSQVVRYEAYDLLFWDRVMVLFWRVFAFLLPHMRQEQKNILSTPPPIHEASSPVVFGGVDESPPSLGGKSSEMTLKNRSGKPFDGLLSPLGIGSTQRPVGRAIPHYYKFIEDKQTYVGEVEPPF